MPDPFAHIAATLRGTALPAMLTKAEATAARLGRAAAVLRASGERELRHAVPLLEVAKRQKVALRDLFAALGVGAELSPDAVTTAVTSRAGAWPKA